METNGSDSGEKAAAHGRTAIHGAHLRTLEALFRHPPAHNLEWMDVVALIEKNRDCAGGGRQQVQLRSWRRTFLDA